MLRILHRLKYRDALSTLPLSSLKPYHHPSLSLPKFRTMTSATLAAERFLADRNAPFCSLEVAKSFAQLTYVLSLIALNFISLKHLCRSKEKKYAHYVGQASWAGARIIQGQWTPQAQSLYDLLILTFSKDGKLADLETLKRESGVSDEDWTNLLQYTAQVRSVCLLDIFHIVIHRLIRF